jgi:hypothetical protein
MMCQMRRNKGRLILVPRPRLHTFPKSYDRVRICRLGGLQQVVKLTADYKTLAASGTADPRLRVTDTVPLVGGGAGNRGLGVNIGLGLGGGATLQPGGVAGGLPGNGLDAFVLNSNC